MRVNPNGPVTAYQTYRIKAPVGTHTRPATCEEVNCPAYLNGWKTIVPADSPQAAYIRSGSGRKFVAAPQPGGLTEFTFEPGQRCFGSDRHRIANGRPEHFIIRDGDWRGNPTGRRVEVSPQSWTDDFGEHQEKLAERLNRG